MLQEDAEECYRDGEGELTLARPPARGSADHRGRDGFVTLLDLCLQRSSPTEQTLLPFAVFISTQVILPTCGPAPACVMASERMSGKRQTDAHIKHMRKKEKLQAGLRKRHIQKGIRNG